MRCLDAWRLCLTVEHESNAVLESGAGASLRRLLCLCAWRLCLTVERGSNAVFGCLATMPDRGAGEQCGVSKRRGRKPAPLALFVRLATMLCPWSMKAMRCLSAWRQCLSVEHESNALFESGAGARP